MSDGGSGHDASPPAKESLSPVAGLALTSVADPMRAVATKVAVLAGQEVSALDVCVVMVRQQQVLEVAFGGQLGAALDERQYRAGYGPALTSAATGRGVVLGEGRRPREFGDFRRLAARHGIRQVRSWPLSTASPSVCWGSLTVYGDGFEPGFDPGPDRFGLFLAAASVLVADVVVFNQAVVTANQMDQAMRSRAVIEQAKGMIMASVRCTDQEAFDRLKRISSRTNRKLRNVATSIVRGASTGVPELVAPGQNSTGQNSSGQKSSGQTSSGPGTSGHRRSELGERGGDVADRD